MDNPVQTSAQQIARQALLKNILTLSDKNSVKKSFLVAGSHQYKSLWTRDFCFASLAANQGDQELLRAVHDSLETFFHFQRADGLLPRGVDSVSVYRRVALGLIGVDTRWGEPFRPWYLTEHGVVCVDSNLLLIWAGFEYVIKSGDLDFAQKWVAVMEKAISYVQENWIHQGLISCQEPYSDWADSVARTGRVAFTNALYLLALKSVQGWFEVLGRKDMAARFAQNAATTQGLFERTFWDEDRGVLINFLKNAEVQSEVGEKNKQADRDRLAQASSLSGDRCRDGLDTLSADVNLLCVAFGLLPEEKTKRIMEGLRKSELWLPVPGRPTWPVYSDSVKSWTVKWVGLKDYHDQLLWLWISALAIRAEEKVGNLEASLSILKHLETQITLDQNVHEVYEVSQGRFFPLKRLLYRAEAPFSWNAGMFLWAAHQIPSAVDSVQFSFQASG